MQTSYQQEQQRRRRIYLPSVNYSRYSWCHGDWYSWCSHDTQCSYSCRGAHCAATLRSVHRSGWRGQRCAGGAASAPQGHDRAGGRQRPRVQMSMLGSSGICCSVSDYSNAGLSGLKRRVIHQHEYDMVSATIMRICACPFCCKDSCTVLHFVAPTACIWTIHSVEQLEVRMQAPALLCCWHSGNLHITHILASRQLCMIGVFTKQCPYVHDLHGLMQNMQAAGIPIRPGLNPQVGSLLPVLLHLSQHGLCCCSMHCLQPPVVPVSMIPRLGPFGYHQPVCTCSPPAACNSAQRPRALTQPHCFASCGALVCSLCVRKHCSMPCLNSRISKCCR